MCYMDIEYKVETVKCERSNNTNPITKLPRNHVIFKRYSRALDAIIVNIDNKPVAFIFKGIDETNTFMTYVAIDVFGVYGKLQHVDPDENTLYGKIYY